MTELAKEPVATSGGSQVYSSLTQDPKIAPYSPLAVHSVSDLKTSWGTYAHLRGGRKKGERKKINGLFYIHIYLINAFLAA